MRRLAMLACAAVALLAVGCARASTHVEVLDSWPAGGDVTLPDGQNFYLHLAYTSDAPAHIWVQPYFEGKLVRAGTSPSRTYPAGHGEALGWFFLFDRGTRVDEVRITAGDGTTRNTSVVASIPVAVTAGDGSAAASEPPAWLASLRERDEAASRADRERAMNTPPGAGDWALLYGFWAIMLTVGTLAFVGPAWGLWRWRGGWRIAAALPPLVMGFVMLRIAVDTHRDPTSHNLWPFEIVMWGLPCCVWTIVLMVVHRLVVPRRS